MHENTSSKRQGDYRLLKSMYIQCINLCLRRSVGVLYFTSETYLLIVRTLSIVEI
jgi:hypothetical protein